MPSQKILDAKKKMVAELVSDYQKAKSFVFADARGLKVSTDTEMRADLRKNNVSYKVIKNTTATLIFKELGIKGLEDILKGPTAIAYSTEDAIIPAKILKQYADKFDKLNLKGGVIEGKAASAEEVKILARIPGKEVLYGQIAYGLLFPMTKLAMLLKAAAEKVQEEGPIDFKVEKKTEPKVEEPKTEPVAEAKEEAKAEPVAEAKEAAKAEPVAETKEEPKAEKAPALTEEVKTEEAPVATEKVKTEPKAKAKAEPKAKPVKEAKAEPKAAKPVAETKTEEAPAEAAAEAKAHKPAKKTTKSTAKKTSEVEEATETKE